MNYDENIDRVCDEIGSFAIQGMLYEAACFPSPGLVSPISTGAHKDMDYYTFIDSTVALAKYFSIFVKEGFKENSEAELFKNIRRIGVQAEKDMFTKTKGINTHKGMIFLMGIGCAAVGRTLKKKEGFSSVREKIKTMTKGIVKNELESLLNIKKNKLSYGDKIFLEHNIKGIKGEVEAGMPIIFDFSLEFYQECDYLEKNKRLVHTLIGIMQISNDTNIIHRHSIEVLDEVKEKARKIISLGGMKTQLGEEMIEALSHEFVKRNISPGGSADLLGVTIFMDLAKKYMEASDK